jgi:DNA repair exonuclease SbcCD ATPase subunit
MNKDIQKIDSELTKLNIQLISLEQKHSSDSDKFQKLQESNKSLKKIFQDQYKGDYFNFCAETRSELDAAEAKLTSLKKSSDLYKNFQEEAEKGGCCPICKRR